MKSKWTIFYIWMKCRHLLCTSRKYLETKKLYTLSWKHWKVFLRASFLYSFKDGGTIADNSRLYKWKTNEHFICKNNSHLSSLIQLKLMILNGSCIFNKWFQNGGLPVNKKRKQIINIYRNQRFTNILNYIKCSILINNKVLFKYQHLNVLSVIETIHG